MDWFNRFLFRTTSQTNFRTTTQTKFCLTGRAKFHIIPGALVGQWNRAGPDLQLQTHTQHTHKLVGPTWRPIESIERGPWDLGTSPEPSQWCMKLIWVGDVRVPSSTVWNWWIEYSYRFLVWQRPPKIHGTHNLTTGILEARRYLRDTVPPDDTLIPGLWIWLSKIPHGTDILADKGFYISPAVCPELNQIKLDSFGRLEKECADNILLLAEARLLLSWSVTMCCYHSILVFLLMCVRCWQSYLTLDAWNE